MLLPSVERTFHTVLGTHLISSSSFLYSSFPHSLLLAECFPLPYSLLATIIFKVRRTLLAGRIPLTPSPSSSLFFAVQLHHSLPHCPPFSPLTISQGTCQIHTHTLPRSSVCFTYICRVYPFCVDANPFIHPFLFCHP